MASSGAARADSSFAEVFTAVADNVGNPSAASGDHRQPGGLGFEKRNSIRFIDGRPDVKIGRGINGGQRMHADEAQPTHAAGKGGKNLFDV